jgi:hypothetical protein
MHFFFHGIVSSQGAARRLTTQRKNMLEIESVGAAGKSDSNRVKKYFRMEVKKIQTTNMLSTTILMTFNCDKNNF